MQNKYKFGCIYKITNIINNKIYIGQHFSNDVNDNYFGSGIALRRAIKKYGRKNFTKDILEVCIPCIHHLNQKEIYYISTYNCIGPTGYNLVGGGNSTKGYKFSKESRKKLSNSRKIGIANGTISVDLFCFDIFVYDLEGNFIGKFFGAKEVSKKLKLKRNSIINALYKKIQLKGFLFFKEPTIFNNYDIYPRKSKGKIYLFGKDKQLISIEDGMVRLCEKYNLNINSVNSASRRFTLHKNKYFIVKEKDLDKFKNI